MNNNFGKINNQHNSASGQKHIPPVKPVFSPEDFFDADGNDVDFNSPKNNKATIDNLSKNRLIETLKNQKNIENKNVSLFSKTKPSFSPEDFFDEQGNEVTEKDTQKADFEKEEIPKEKEEDDISCLRCIHYYVSWNKKYPRGCQKYGFETDLMPSDAVLIYSCKSCEYYKNKFKKTDPNLFAEILKKAQK